MARESLERGQSRVENVVLIMNNAWRWLNSIHEPGHRTQRHSPCQTGTVVLYWNVKRLADPIRDERPQL